MAPEVPDDSEFQQQVLDHLDSFLELLTGRPHYGSFPKIKSKSSEAVQIVTTRVLEKFSNIPLGETLPRFVKMLDYLAELDEGQKVPIILHTKIITTLKNIDIDLSDEKQVYSYRRLFFYIYDEDELTIGQSLWMTLQEGRWALKFGIGHSTEGGIPKDLTGEDFVEFARAFLR